MALDIRVGTSIMAPPFFLELAKANKPGTCFLTSGQELPFDRIDLGVDDTAILWHDEARTCVRLAHVAAVRED